MIHSYTSSFINTTVGHSGLKIDNDYQGSMIIPKTVPDIFLEPKSHIHCSLDFYFSRASRALAILFIEKSKPCQKKGMAVGVSCLTNGLMKAQKRTRKLANELIERQKSEQTPFSGWWDTGASMAFISRVDLTNPTKAYEAGEGLNPISMKVTH